MPQMLQHPPGFPFVGTRHLHATQGAPFVLCSENAWHAADVSSKYASIQYRQRSYLLLVFIATYSDVDRLHMLTDVNASKVV
jgi:hypothetical protein